MSSFLRSCFEAIPVCLTSAILQFFSCYEQFTDLRRMRSVSTYAVYTASHVSTLPPTFTHYRI